MAHMKKGHEVPYTNYIWVLFEGCMSDARPLGFRQVLVVAVLRANLCPRTLGMPLLFGIACWLLVYTCYRHRGPFLVPRKAT